MNELAIIKPQAKEIDVRRNMMQNEVLLQGLTNTEKRILTQSTKHLVRETDAHELAVTLKGVFKYVSIDLGCNNNNQEIWTYTQTRMTSVIIDNYGDLAVPEIKTAFDMLLIGELDKYLPKDRNGYAERNCYNNFNVAFLCRVLDAYRKRRNDVVGKVYELQTNQQRAIEQKKTNAVINAYAVRKTKNAYLQYKYKGKLVNDKVSEMMIWQTLQAMGKVTEATITEADRKKAMWDYRAERQKGVINQHTAYYVINEGIKSKELDFPALQNARRREIKNVFDNLLKEEFIWN